MDINIKMCKKCFEKGKYSILNYEIKDVLNEIQYKCIKDNEIKKENIIEMKLTENIKKKLNYCEKHYDKRYCAWCNKCKKNLCYLCISEEKHDYILSCHLFPSIQICNIFQNLIKEFLYIRIEYNIYLPQFINNVNKIIYIYELFYKLIKEDNCINYQILLNLEYNINNYIKVIDEFREKIFKEIIKLNEMENLNEKYKENIIRFPIKIIDCNLENLDIISLDLKQEIPKKEEIKYTNNKKFEKIISQKPFVIYFKFLFYLDFYDNKGQFINKKTHTYFINRQCDTFHFKENILILICELSIFFFIYFF